MASPFVTSYLQEKMGQISDVPERVLVTNTDIRTFISQSSDIDALDGMLKTGVRLHSVCRLHAKVYVIDESAALVTSANATHGGMFRNFECGVATTDKGIIREVAQLIVNGFGVEGGPQEIASQDITTIRVLSEHFISQRADVFMQGFAEDGPSKFVIKNSAEQMALLSRFSGWMALTFEGILNLENDKFSLDDLERVCIAKAAQVYPENKHVRAKLRQQLQQLRDLGLVNFLGDGFYLRLLANHQEG